MPYACEDGILLILNEKSDIDVEIFTFVVKGSAKLTVPPNRQHFIQVGSRGVDLRSVFYLKLSGIHPTKINPIILIID